MSQKRSKLLTLVGPFLLLSGCVATAVAGAAVSSTGDVAEGVARAGAKTVDLAGDALPGGSEDD